MENKEKLQLRCPVVVEGKYDKVRLSNLVCSPIIVLNGFSVFNDSQKIDLLRRMCDSTGLILLMDSDRAGAFIRSKLKGVLRPDKIWQVYTPKVPGKEKRKAKPSAEGILGVEGISSDLLYNLLKPYSLEAGPVVGACISKTEWYCDGYSGGENSEMKRKKLAQSLSLPDNLSSKALMEAINLMISREEYEHAKNE